MKDAKSDDAEVRAFQVGDRVRATHKPEHDREYDIGFAFDRKLRSGSPGTITDRSDSHGVCFRVEHDNAGPAWWEPDELTLLPPEVRAVEVADAEIAEVLQAERITDVVPCERAMGTRRALSTLHRMARELQALRAELANEKAEHQATRDVDAEVERRARYAWAAKEIRTPDVAAWLALPETERVGWRAVVRVNVEREAQLRRALAATEERARDDAADQAVDAVLGAERLRTALASICHGATVGLDAEAMAKIAREAFGVQPPQPPSEDDAEERGVPADDVAAVAALAGVDPPQQSSAGGSFYVATTDHGARVVRHGWVMATCEAKDRSANIADAHTITMALNRPAIEEWEAATKREAADRLAAEQKLARVVSLAQALFAAQRGDRATAAYEASEALRAYVEAIAGDVQPTRPCADCGVAAGEPCVTASNHAPWAGVSHASRIRGDVPPTLTEERAREAHARCCVAALVTDKAGRLLLIRSKKAGRGWELPGGKVIAGEMWRDALRREVREEAGIDITISDEPPRVLDGKPVEGAAFTSVILVARASGEGEPKAGDDAAEARWFAAADVPLAELSEFASTNEVRCWVNIARGDYGPASEVRKPDAPQTLTREQAEMWAEQLDDRCMALSSTAKGVLVEALMAAARGETEPR